MSASRSRSLLRGSGVSVVLVLGDSFVVEIGIGGVGGLPFGLVSLASSLEERRSKPCMSNHCCLLFLHFGLSRSSSCLNLQLSRSLHPFPM